MRRRDFITCLGLECLDHYDCGVAVAAALLANILALIPRTRAAGMTAFMIRLIRPGMMIGRFLVKARNPS